MGGVLCGTRLDPGEADRRYREYMSEKRKIERSEYNAQRARICAILEGCYLFDGLSQEQLDACLAAMIGEEYEPGEHVVRAGESGDRFYIVEQGELAVLDQDETSELFRLTRGATFGEMALLYEVPRSNSVCVVGAEPAELWSLDASVFREQCLDVFRTKREYWEELLSAVPLFSMLLPWERAFIADSLRTQEVHVGELVFCAGDPGDAFYVVEHGQLDALVRTASGEERVVAKYGRGGFFGELALLSDGPRKATLQARTQSRLARMDKVRFNQLSDGVRQRIGAQADQYVKLKAQDTTKAGGQALSGFEEASLMHGSNEIKSGQDERNVAVSSWQQNIAMPSLASYAARTPSEMLEESGTSDSPLPSPGHIPKGPPPRGKVRKARLVQALSQSIAFRGVSESALRQEVEYMEETIIAPGETLIQAGEEGDYMYVLEAGELDVLQRPSQGGSPRAVHRVESGKVVGELALMYHCKRDATVVACARGAKVWALPAYCFERAAGHRVRQQRALASEFLAHVPLFHGLPAAEVGRIADCLHVELFDAHQTIVKAGQTGERFFLVEKGKARAYKEDFAHARERDSGKRTFTSDTQAELVEVATFGRGSYFGELALLYGQPRVATVVALMPTRCAVLNRKDFLRLAAEGTELRVRLEAELQRYS
mmetsp:Transcript_24493/g.83731  ORF Transcript_24493/g.83731 Transcript_24493/m.83731 type:complete len:659 (+) Transcript_24493:279-2255(+)